MAECKHPRLILLEDNPGETSNRYQCEACKEIFIMDLTPYKIGVSFGEMK